MRIKLFKILLNNLWQLTVVFIVGSTSVALAQSAKPDFPNIQLNRVVHGEEAITALGDRLPEVAEWYETNPNELKRILRHDKTLRVDKHGQLFYQCSKGEHKDPQAFSLEGLFQVPVYEAPFALNETFLLHSRPGSSKVIYLDTNGATISGTAWNVRRHSAPHLEVEDKYDKVHDPIRRAKWI